ncbi:VanZ family protein [Roseateles cavernae]|uniref:VanZ family protein n=1 Tax=Roseateles cavernae TaxID=3153578 RepID=UPI0032E3B945
MMARWLPQPLPRRRSSATLLALAYAGLVVYASLYPFWPWTLPPTVEAWGLIGLPWPKYWGGFDVHANLLGYMPLGLLVFAAAVRSGQRLRRCLLLGLLLPPLLSFGMESLQYFLPRRVPSLVDWLLNSAGAAAGLLLGLVLYVAGGLTRWQGRREHWFVPHSAGALALLALWPVALLFPAPVPLGLGQVLPRLQELAASLLEGTPWALQWEELAEPALQRALPPGLEGITIALGLLAPCLLALSVARPGWQRLALVFGAAALGVLSTALSTALNFGPQHAWAWLTLSTWPGLALGLGLACILCAFSRRACAAWGLVVTSALIAMVSEAPTDPYLAQSLQAWEQGRFISFYGLAQWVGWLWPFGVLAWLLALLAQREVRASGTG